MLMLWAKLLTVCDPAFLAKVIKLVLKVNEGRSFTALMVRVMLFVTLLVPSVPTNETVIFPFWLVTEYSETVLFVDVPENTIFVAPRMFVLLEDAVTVIFVTSLSTSATENEIFVVPKSSFSVLLAKLSRDGASLTGETVTSNVLVAVRAPSLAIKVMVADPLAFATLVKATVRFVVLPVVETRTIFVAEDEADTETFAMVVSTSVSVYVILVVPKSSFNVLLVIEPKMGASLTLATEIEKVFVAESRPLLAVPPLSIMRTVIRFVPNLLVASVNDRIPLVLI